MVEYNVEGIVEKIVTHWEVTLLLTLLNMSLSNNALNRAKI